MTHASFALAAALCGAVSLGFLACAPTDTGNPPVELNETRVAGEAAFNQVGITVQLHGGHEAVVPADGHLFFFELDLAGANPRRSIRSAVLADGSFEAALEPLTSGPLRAFARTSTGLSEVVDWDIAGGSLTPRDRSLDSCVQIRRVVEIERDGSGQVDVYNECTTSLYLSLRTVSDELSVVAPEIVPVGTIGALLIDAESSADGYAIGEVYVRFDGGASGGVRLTVLTVSP